MSPNVARNPERGEEKKHNQISQPPTTLSWKFTIRENQFMKFFEMDFCGLVFKVAKVCLE